MLVMRCQLSPASVGYQVMSAGCQFWVCKVDETTDLRELYRQTEWGDLWDDAFMRSVILYLRGSKKLRIPEGWRELLPHTL